jgi:endoglucanase
MTEMHDKSERIFQLLQELLEIPAPTGHEEPVRDWLRANWRDRVEEWIEDPVGNIACRVGGSGRRLLIQAHMDELGFVVRYITPQGFLVLDPGQGDRHASAHQRYMIGHMAQVVGRYGVVAEGVFATVTGHAATQAQSEKSYLGYNDFFVDIGARTRWEAESKGVYIGAGVIWYAPTRRLGARIVGKAMDDRMLLAIMTLLLDELDRDALNYELWFGATIQEENGVHGASALSHHMSFDLAIPLEVGLVGDIPTVGEREYPIQLGYGPTLVHKDRHIHYDKRLLWQLADVALLHHIPFQHGIYSKFGSDGIAFMDHGIPSALIGVPTRYTHSVFEMVDERDIISTVGLLNAFATHHSTT